MDPKDIISYQYRFIVWAIYTTAVGLSVVANIWLCMIGTLSLRDTWPSFLVWLALAFIAGMTQPDK